MFDKVIQSLLEKKLSVLPALVCARSLRHDIDDLVALHFPSMKLAIVCDKHTHEAFGDAVYKALKGRFELTLILLEGAPKASETYVDAIRQQSARCDALIAVGSGTVNDLCKYASFSDGKPYLVFPTAASMNGYLSANASIVLGGYKKTLPAHQPQAVLCDLSVIANAPRRMAKSGLGDCLARPTAQADWLLSHLLLGTVYDDAPFELLAPYEPDVFDRARGIALGDMGCVELLVKLLLLSGLGMTIAGGSYPASQAEHMIAHAMEMLPGTPEDTLHGEEIGVTTLTMARMQEQALRAPPRLRSLAFDEALLSEHYGKAIAVEAKKTFHIKQEKIEASYSMGNWDEIAARIERVMIPSSQLQSILELAEACMLPKDVKWEDANYTMALKTARFLRERFTFLDVE